jgi:hypothetical protein
MNDFQASGFAIITACLASHLPGFVKQRPESLIQSQQPADCLDIFYPIS